MLQESLRRTDGESAWWARQDLNLGPMDYESTALTAELRARDELTLTCPVDFARLQNR